MDKIYDLFYQPRVLFKERTEFCPKDITLAVIIVFLFSISLPISLALISPYKDFKIFLIQFLINPFLVFLFWILSTGILHIFAELLLSKGNILKLFTCLGFSYMPMLLYTPFCIFIFNLPSTCKILLFLILALGLSVWYLILQIYSIMATYNISKSKALFIIFLPFLIIVSVIFLIFLISFIILILSILSGI